MQSHGKKQLISRTSALQRQPYGSRRAIQNPRRSHGTWQYVQTQHPIETSANENEIAFYSQADHLQIRGCSYASSLPVTWQRWRSHHSIRRSRKSHAASKLRCSMFYRASYCRSNFCIARIWIFLHFLFLWPWPWPDDLHIRLQNLGLSSAVASRLISLGAAFRDTLTVVVPEKWLCHSGHVNRFCYLLTDWLVFPGDIREVKVWQTDIDTAQII